MRAPQTPLRSARPVESHWGIPWIIGAVALLLAAVTYAVAGRCGPFLFIGGVLALTRLNFERSWSPILVWWLLGAVGILVASREVDGYVKYVQHLTFPRAIDWAYVRGLWMTQAGVVATVVAILRPWSYVPGSKEALAAFAVLLFIIGFLSLVGIMHTPPEFDALWRWVVTGLLGCGILGVRRGRVLG